MVARSVFDRESWISDTHVSIERVGGSAIGDAVCTTIAASCSRHHAREASLSRSWDSVAGDGAVIEVGAESSSWQANHRSTVMAVVKDGVMRTWWLEPGYALRR